jgi:glutamine synthetase
VLLAQWVLRRLAHAEGMRVSFEPVLRAGHAGNGLHFHCAFRGGAGTEVGAAPFDPVKDAGGLLTDPARWLVGGFVRHGDALMAFGNRRETSFLRLRQAREAPSRIAWGEYDRSALVRIPVVPLGEDGGPVAPATVEFRLPDGSAHPHLLLAAMAQCVAAARGAKDLEELLSATKAGAGANSPLATTIPRSFAEVGEALSWHRGVLEAGGVFPPSLLDALLGTLSAGPGAPPPG